jgi:hypothetical protein
MLGIGSGSFDPETLVILETAFDEAWISLKTNGSANIRPDELARRICHLAMEGERDPVRLHDRALDSRADCRALCFSAPAGSRYARRWRRRVRI